jgi:hypothetical protein
MGQRNDVDPVLVFERSRTDKELDDQGRLEKEIRRDF